MIVCVPDVLEYHYDVEHTLEHKSWVTFSTRDLFCTIVSVASRVVPPVMIACVLECHYHVLHTLERKIWAVQSFLLYKVSCKIF